MLSNKTWKIHLFHCKTVYKGPKYVPKPLLYSHIKYIYLSYLFEWQKTDLNPFFHLIPWSPVSPKYFHIFFSTLEKFDPFYWKWSISIVPPRNLYLYFKKILEKGQFHIEKPEKNYNTMTYPPFVLFDNTNSKHQNTWDITIFWTSMMCNIVHLY